MSTVTLPSWFWMIYYLFLLITVGTATFCLIRSRMTGWSLLVIGISCSLPIVSLLNSIGREEGMNEFEHLYNQLQQGSLWSFYVFLGYLYTLVWWFLFLKKNFLKLKG
ncbi:hypothetical protein JOC77_001180 [Peribacillus deserti]|uniref:MFS transporter n=1 Tax=Peribacillus deserti TaxID=673318 RepID=A0ABS2QF46_9BACI|nr:hypothetical protein [Peribacillus deserti]MBM7691773.1 hypothetical protein [Peribacillus deserti]